MRRLGETDGPSALGQLIATPEIMPKITPTMTKRLLPRSPSPVENRNFARRKIDTASDLWIEIARSCTRITRHRKMHSRDSFGMHSDRRYRLANSSLACSCTLYEPTFIYYSHRSDTCDACMHTCMHVADRIRKSEQARDAPAWSRVACLLACFLSSNVNIRDHEDVIARN